MSAKVILTVQGGRYDGHELALNDHESFFLGRARDCSFPIAGCDENLVISRHHCQITVGLPEIRIRDLGSRNGTFLNGQAIGRRPRGVSPEEATAAPGPEYPVQESDEIQIGDLVFKVRIAVVDDAEEPVESKNRESLVRR
jgi:pSer/pThr/pTyr-binding forkhead associated (FHA) protein